MPTKKIRAVAEVHHNDTLLSALEQNILGVILIDELDKIIFFNSAAEELWGYRRDEVLGQNVSVLVPSSLRTAHPQYIQHNREGGQSRVEGMSRELLLERKDGSGLWTRFALSRFSASGKTGYLALVRDASQEVIQREQSRLLLLAVDHLTKPVVVMDPEFHIVQFNRAFAGLSGLSGHDVMGKRLDEALTIPASWTREQQKLQKLLHNNVRSREEFKAVDGSGEAVWLNASLNPIFDKDNQVQNLVVTFYDVTEERKIRDFESTLLSAICNYHPFDELCDILCQSIVSVIGGSQVAFELMSPHRVFIAGEAPPLPGTKHTVTIPLPDKQPGAVLTVHTPAGLGGAVLTERMISISQYMATLLLAQEHSRQQIDSLIKFDRLTGLPNRNHMHHFLDQLILNGEGAAPVIFLMSIDHFQDVIDSHGYAVADQVLVTVANRLSGILRPGQYLCRTEGAEFVLIDQESDLSNMTRVSEALEHLISASFQIDGLSFFLTLSIGISHEAGRSQDWLLSTAHRAMELVRKTGGNNREFFSPELSKAVNERLLLGAALKRAVSDSHLRLVYQPQIYANTGALYGCEALIRWNDPEHGEVPPSRFIPLAEETGEYEEIGLWVIREACRQLAEWRALRIDIPVISVNLSARHFQNRRFPDQVLSVMKEFGIPGEQLMLEITESMMLTDDEEVLRRIQILRNAGLGLSIDDFGTGFSGLSRLARFPVTEIKIDKSFVSGYPEDNRQRSLLEAIIGIGQSFSLNVIAEGVETSEQFQLLRELGCPVIQGYYYSRPIPASEIPGWYRRVSHLPGN
ncbi:oxygen-sensing cyclic-di-GMP phosphodiesterase DosP [[Enterobacter] lignolyticus]|uniref:cyclic-guanylate-specific phosphodiesterase n=1 Tax=[Enterobacter] lignolyticus TaxID=1334193 RepID=A0A806X8Y0_9ENTR|nr:oxygen-sensing cyclic-di-GMP phosphodiesterase DosP [[Enterobacter] lignolyticus]ALR78035.1 c-di-GMP phosphodiesterase [[Enterobacter] lignolyticus]